MSSKCPNMWNICRFLSFFVRFSLFQYIDVPELAISSTRVHELTENNVKLELVSYRKSTTFDDFNSNIRCYFWQGNHQNTWETLTLSFLSQPPVLPPVWTCLHPRCFSVPSLLVTSVWCVRSDVTTSNMEPDSLMSSPTCPRQAHNTLSTVLLVLNLGSEKVRKEC